MGGADRSRPQGATVAGTPEIEIRAGESVEGALKRFRPKVLQEEIIKDIERHAYI